MEISSFEMWFYFTFLHNLATSKALNVIIFTVCFVCFLVGGIINIEDAYKKTSKSLIYIGSIVLLFAAIKIAVVPSSKQIAAIILVPAIVNNENVQNIGSKSLDILNGYLEQWAQDIVPTKPQQEEKL